MLLYSASERIDAAKSAGEADRPALRSAVARAETSLAENAKVEAVHGWPAKERLAAGQSVPVSRMPSRPGPALDNLLLIPVVAPIALSLTGLNTAECFVWGVPVRVAARCEFFRLDLETACLMTASSGSS